MKKLLEAFLYFFMLCFCLNCHADEVLIDPTKPPASLLTQGTTTQGPLKLTAIFSYSDHRVAVINGIMAQVGDKIDNFSVTSITQNTVELVGSDGEKRVLDLAPDIKSNR